MRILQVHNKYRPGWGGEDTVVELEGGLLRRNGHEVERLSAWTKDLDEASTFRLLAAGLGTVWSFRGYSQVRSAIKRFSPDVVHVHNTFPLLSPSVFWAAHRAGVAVVLTLHNFRITCANAKLLRNDQPCELCVGRLPFPALRYRCLGSSLFRTAAVCSMNIFHKFIKTYCTKVNAHIVLSQFTRDVMARAGLPTERLYVKPNFNPVSSKLTTLRHRRMVFVGEICRAKGVHLLLEAWKNLGPRDYELTIVGDGPDREQLERNYPSDGKIVWAGQQARERVIDLLAGSRWFCLPSLAYENCPMTILEAFSVGTPVIVPNHGAFRTIATEDKEGLFFRAGDADSLADSIARALQLSDAAWLDYSRRAHNTFLREYTERANYEQLMHVYRSAINCMDVARLPTSTRYASDEIAVAGDALTRTYDNHE